jgi:MFS family permease
MFSRKRIDFLFLNVGHFYDHLVILLYATVAALALPSVFGLGYGELIIYATPMLVAFGAFALPAGWLADRWSRRGMLLVFFIGVGIATLVTGLARTPLEVAVGLFFIGAFAAIYHPVGITMVVETHRERTGMALGINGVWGNMGVAAAAVTAGVLIDVAGWRAAFMVPGAIILATGLAYGLWCLRTPASAEEHAARRGAAGAPAQWVLDRSTLLRVFVVIALTTTLGSFIFQATTFTLPKVFEERLGDIASSATAIGSWAFLVFAIASFAQVLIGHLVDRFRIRSVYLWVTALQIPVFLLIVGLSGLPVILGAVVFMLLVFGQIPINDALLSRITTAQYRSRVYGLKFVLSFAVSAAAIPTVALIHGSAGFDGMFTAMAVVALVIALAVFTLPRGGERTAQVASAA